MSEFQNWVIFAGWSIYPAFFFNLIFKTKQIDIVDLRLTEVIVNINGRKINTFKDVNAHI